MSTITLNDLKTEHSKLAQMIAAFEAQARTSFHLSEQTIELAPGEHYAGIIIGRDGVASHHLILLPGEADDLNWSEAKAWAAQSGGDLPNRREQSLLYANCKDQFAGEWYWSSEAHEDSRSAWAQYFDDGHQGDVNAGLQFRARAVRRLVIE